MADKGKNSDYLKKHGAEVKAMSDAANQMVNKLQMPNAYSKPKQKGTNGMKPKKK